MPSTEDRHDATESVGHEHLGRPREIVAGETPLNDRDGRRGQLLDDARAGCAGQDAAVERRRVDAVIQNDEEVGAARLEDTAVRVDEQRIAVGSAV